MDMDTYLDLDMDMGVDSDMDMGVDSDLDEKVCNMLDRFGDSLLRMCFLYLRDAHLAEDAVQETFIKVIKNYDKFKGISDEKTWVMRIAINSCKNYLRSPWKKHVDGSAALENIPADEYETDERHDAVISEIMKLPAKYKDVILLYYYQEMKQKEIAAALKIPEATVSTRLARARSKLKVTLGGLFDE